MLFLLLPIAWLVAEVYVAIQVAGAIGALATAVLLIAGWPVGAWALRSQGGAAWRRLSAAVGAGRSPGREVLDGALILLGGTLLIVPGFITDVIGIVLLLPPTRAWMRRPLSRHLQSRLVVRATRFGPTARSYDVDSTATDIEQPQLGP
jgi:UPF0716 protein FxsA